MPLACRTATPAARPLLIKGARVITMDPAPGDLLSADILARNGLIAEISGMIDIPEAEVVDGSAMIAMPGFVDGHRHMWEGVIRGTLPVEDLRGYIQKVNQGFAQVCSAEDAYRGTLISALGALDAGATTVFDWSHIQTTPDHTAACLSAVRESGLRAVFAFGMPGAQDKGHAWPQDLLRLRKGESASEDQPITLASASLSPEHVPDEMAKAHFAMAREADVIISAHAGLVGMGTPDQIGRFGREGELGPKVNLVHRNTLSAAEWKIIADTGTSVCITPSAALVMPRRCGRRSPPRPRRRGRSPGRRARRCRGFAAGR